MTEAAINEETKDVETLKAKQEGEGVLQIDRSLDGQTITIYIKHPLLAGIVRQMALGNAPTNAYDEIYKPLLTTIPKHPERVYTRPAVSKITKNLVAAGDFSWDAPRGVLVYNPDLLEAGYKLTYKVEVPFAPDLARKWGKMFMDGCNDIIANARPFQMTWVMKEKPVTSQAIPPMDLQIAGPHDDHEGPF